MQTVGVLHVVSIHVTYVSTVLLPTRAHYQSALRPQLNTGSSVGFSIFGKLVSAIASRILRILMERIDSICNLASELFFDCLYFIRIHDTFEVITKRIFSKIAKSDFLLSEDRSTTQNGAKLYRDEVQKKTFKLMFKRFLIQMVNS